LVLTTRWRSALALFSMGSSNFATTTMPTPYVAPSCSRPPAVVSRYTSVWLPGDSVLKLDVWRVGMPLGPRAVMLMV